MPAYFGDERDERKVEDAVTKKDTVIETKKEQENKKPSFEDMYWNGELRTTSDSLETLRQIVESIPGKPYPSSMSAAYHDAACRHSFTREQIQNAANSCLPAPPHQGLRRTIKMIVPRDPVLSSMDLCTGLDVVDIEVVSVERGGKLVWVEAKTVYK